MITDVEHYFESGCGRCDRFGTPDCSTRLWAKGLADLRRICRDSGMSEHVKWGHPCYMHSDRNIVIIGAFRDDFRLTFFNAALMRDPHGVLIGQGPNSSHPDCFKFDDDRQVVGSEAILREYLAEAIGYAEQGTRPPKVVRELELPDEFLDALESDPELAQAFALLTPGRQRSYGFALNSAKTSATKVARIIKFRDKILAGKGALDR
ncbi:MAG TPA: YdeI/OmpD-associated family protein [Ilumatobacteraceae bacterium]|nr:YdeI/OmpD-associated family protein [Ilumatobacteraceae bacterium]HRB02135.1 YdeI/OmpD-associated family protein [Ilumatobacteraceae bacterium]